MRRDGRAAETAVMRGVLHPQDRAASRRELVARGPVRPAERALAPDLAGGGMLLLIVLSNTGFHLWAASWGLGLGALLGSATMAAFAVGVWLVTVAGAYAMDRAGWRGPAEVLLRRLTYGTAINPPAGEPATRWRGGRGRRG